MMFRNHAAMTLSSRCSKCRVVASVFVFVFLHCVDFGCLPKTYHASDQNTTNNNNNNEKMANPSRNHTSDTPIRQKDTLDWRVWLKGGGCYFRTWIFVCGILFAGCRS